MIVIKVWIAAVIMLFTVSVSWWVSMPMMASVAEAVSGGLAPEAATIVRFASMIAAVWGPLLDIFIVLWAFLKGVQRDVESELFG